MGRKRIEVPEKYATCSCGGDTHYISQKDHRFQCLKCKKTFTGSEDQTKDTKKTRSEYKRNNLNGLVEEQIQLFEKQKSINKSDAKFSMLDFSIFKDDMKKIEKKDRVIVESFIRCGGSYLNACGLINETYSKVFRIMKKYEWMIAKVFEIMLSSVEDVAWQSCLIKKNPNMIQFMLKSLNPKYKEKIENEVKMKNISEIEVVIQDVEYIEENENDGTR
jgi:hypothetical protein